MVSRKQIVEWRFATINKFYMEIFKQADATPAERLIWTVLWRSADHRGVVSLSYSRIANESGYHKQTCMDAIKSLIEKELVVRLKRGNRSGRVNQYAIRICKPDEPRKNRKSNTEKT